MPLSSLVLDADGPTMIRAGSFGFVTCNICGNTWGEVQFGLDGSVRTRMLGGYPVTPPEAAFLAWVPRIFQSRHFGVRVAGQALVT